MQLLLALRRLGVHALGVDNVDDAALLLDALDAEVTLVRSGELESALDRLREKSLVIEVEPGATLAETVALLRMLGRPEVTAQLN